MAHIPHRTLLEKLGTADISVGSCDSLLTYKRSFVAQSGPQCANLSAFTEPHPHRDNGQRHQAALIELNKYAACICKATRNSHTTTARINTMEPSVHPQVPVRRSSDWDNVKASRTTERETDLRRICLACILTLDAVLHLVLPRPFLPPSLSHAYSDVERRKTCLEYCLLARPECKASEL